MGEVKIKTPESEQRVPLKERPGAHGLTIPERVGEKQPVNRGQQHSGWGGKGKTLAIGPAVTKIFEAPTKGMPGTEKREEKAPSKSPGYGVAPATTKKKTKTHSPKTGALGGETIRKDLRNQHTRNKRRRFTQNRTIFSKTRSRWKETQKEKTELWRTLSRITGMVTAQLGNKSKVKKKVLKIGGGGGGLVKRLQP